MAVQSPPIPPKQVAPKSASPLKISPTPSKTSPMNMAAKSPVSAVPTGSSTPTTPTTPGTPAVPLMPGQAEPKKRKWLWILLGIFGVIIVLAIGLGLYLGLSN